MLHDTGWLRVQNAAQERLMEARSTALLLLVAVGIFPAPFSAAELQPSFACAVADDAAICAALGSLYAATDGPTWSAAALSGQSWADAAAGVLRPPLCSLTGVGCDGGALTSLCVVPCPSCVLCIGSSRGPAACRSLSNQGLRGTLPAALAALHGLHHLCVACAAYLPQQARDELRPAPGRRDLSHNELLGSLPAALLNLSSSLETLALNNNRLGGTLPDWLGALAALRVLDLSVNELRGPLPSSLPELHTLRTLSLHDNPLHATIPDAIGDMASLELLELHYTGLVGTVPASLGRLRALTMLALQNNNLMGDIPEALSTLPLLRVLFLFDNMLLLGRAPPAWVANSSIPVLRVGEQRPLPPPPPHVLAAYCEAPRGGPVAQPVDSYSNVPFVLLGAHQLAVGLRDARRSRLKHDDCSDGATPRRAMERFALFSVLNGCTQVYAGVGSFLFHADAVAQAQLLDMSAVLLALAVPALYAFWRVGLFGPPHARVAHALLACAVGAAVLCFYQFKELLRERAGGSLALVLPLLGLMVGALMAWAWLLGSPAENEAVLPDCCADMVTPSVAGALRRAWSRRMLPRGLRYRYAVAAAVSGAAAFAARQMDVKLHMYCWPRSAFQLHAAWHVLAALALYALWHFLRTEEEDVRGDAPGADVALAAL